MTLDATVVMSISVRDSLSMNPASAPLAVPPSLSSVGALTSAAAAILLPCVKTQLVTCLAVPDEANEIRPNSSSQGSVRPGAFPNTLSFGVKSYTYVPPIRDHGAPVAFVTSGVEIFPNLFMILRWGYISLFFSTFNFRCAWLGPQPLPLSEFIHLPCYTHC